MTQAEKLEALVRRAIEGGWDSPWQDYNYPLIYSEVGIWPKEDSDYSTSVKDVLFNHDFARALFGNTFDQSVSQYIPDTEDTPSAPQAHYNSFTFKYRLMMAVISDDPIGYMYEAVFGDSATLKT